jgi:immunity protein 26 of polymorphic toxin system
VAAVPPAYPFVPKSNAYVRAGQFWAVPLSDGRFACGRVLDVPPTGDLHVPANSRMFLAGLMDWVGTESPTDESIAGAHLIAQGFAHIKAIVTTGGEVLGHRDLEADGIVPERWRSHVAGGTVWIYEGARRLRPATPDDRDLPLMGTWGYSVVRVLAEQRFVGAA